MGHDFGLVMVTYARVGEVVGQRGKAVKMVYACRTCGMRPDGSGQIHGVNVFRRTSCTDGVHPRHDKV